MQRIWNTSGQFIQYFWQSQITFQHTVLRETVTKTKHHAKQLRAANVSNLYVEPLTKFKLKGWQEGMNSRSSMWFPKSIILMKIHDVLTFGATVMCNVAHILHKYWHLQTTFKYAFIKTVEKPVLLDQECNINLYRTKVTFAVTQVKV
jgi:hypothetical protein